MYMFNLFYVCINLSSCTVIPNSKQISLYVVVRAHKLEELPEPSYRENEKNEMKTSQFGEVQFCFIRCWGKDPISI